jgi:PKD repeat protein
MSYKKVAITGLVLGLAILVQCAYGSVVSCPDAIINTTGSSVPVTLVLDQAPAGLSGYNITLSIDNPSIAQIDSVDFPAWATDELNGTVPSSRLWIAAIDSSGEHVPNGSVNVSLATVTVHGLSSGTTALRLTVTQMDDNSGGMISPTVVNGTIRVNSTGPVSPSILTVSPQTATFPVQGTQQYLVIVDTLPEGLSGYDMALNLSNTGIARFSAVTFPPWAVLTNATPLPAESVRISAVDVNGAVQPGSTNVTLATVTVQGNAAGTTPLTIGDVHLDDEDGVPVNPVIVNGQAIVTGSGPVPPVANFNKNVSSGPAPLAVQFTDTSTGGAATSWAWDFKNDGVIESTVQDPVYVYTTPGTYSVNLTVSNAAGSDSRLKENFITVTEPVPVPPVAAFSASPTSGNAPLTVQFTDNSTNTPTSWAWNFGDGSAINTAQNPSHIYSAVGVYSVNLTVSNAGGSNSLVRSNYINVTNTPIPAPVAVFSASPTSGNAPLTVQFTDNSTNNPTSWALDFGDDSAIGTAQNPSHIYSAVGVYSVNLTVSNAGGSNSLVRSNYINVTTTPIPAPDADFSASPTSGTAPLSVQFTDQSTGQVTSWAWNFGDGSAISTAQNPSHTYQNAGTYSVNLTVTGPGGADSKFKANYIGVTSPPVTDAFIGNPLSGIAPLRVQFTELSTGNPWYRFWTFGDSPQIFTGKNPVHVYSHTGIYTVTLNAIGPNGNVTYTQPMYIHVTAKPKANFLAGGSSDLGPFTIKFSDMSTEIPTTWLWNFGDGSGSSDQNPVHTYAKSGTFSVQLTASNDAGSSMITKRVTVMIPVSTGS